MFDELLQAHYDANLAGKSSGQFSCLLDHLQSTQHQPHLIELVSLLVCRQHLAAQKAQRHITIHSNACKPKLRCCITLMLCLRFQNCSR